MRVDVLVAEIGSTTTLVNAFMLEPNPVFLGQGAAHTSVEIGDVTIGLMNAVESLKIALRTDELVWGEMFATSSAAGGLKMSVHGLVYDMTVRAAKEAALGAGAVLKLVTAGKLSDTDLESIHEIKPNILLLAGGVDYGERETAVYNAELLTKCCPDIPMIYAGNIQSRSDIKRLAERTGMQVYITENVYPKVDVLMVEPARKIIHDAFEEHIIHAPGMKEVRRMVNGPIIPTPGAVMLAAKALYEQMGDLIVFDVGGATTDLHSVTEGTESVQLLTTQPEPLAKRTVEGDLGVYVNARHIVEKIGVENCKRIFPDAEGLLDNLKPIPQSQEEIRFVQYLTEAAVLTALERHAGCIKDLYGPTGKKSIAEGKDLTAVRAIIGTGGALTRLPDAENILQKVTQPDGRRLYPSKESKVHIDHDYIFASAGVLSLQYKQEAIELMRKSMFYDLPSASEDFVS